VLRELSRVWLNISCYVVREKRAGEPGAGRAQGGQGTFGEDHGVSARGNFSMKSTGMNKRKRIRKTKGTAAGREIIGALTELAEVLESGQPLQSHFTVRTAMAPRRPSAYNASGVRKARAKVGASQALFAGLMGVSTVLVQHWENGHRVPALWACRLLDEINRDPAHWRSLLRPLPRRGSAA